MIQPRDNSNAEDVQKYLQRRQHNHYGDLEIPVGERTPNRNVKIVRYMEDTSRSANYINRRGDVNASDDGHLANHVHPRCPPRPFPTAEPVSPKVKSARCRIR